MESILERKNMKRALKRVIQNGGAPGVDGMTVHKLKGYLRRHWPKIKQALLDGVYDPLPVRRKEIDKPEGGVRLLGIPTTLDRLIQQAVAQVLNDIWEKEGAEAYLGMTHTGFPNFFMMYGPNTNLGHNSIVIMIEAQTRYILKCLDALSSRSAQWLDVKASVQETYNAWLQERMQDMIWSAVDRSWYKNEAGKITNNWVGRTTEYRKRTRRLNADDYDFA